MEAALGIGRTIYVCIILGFGALIFTKDANDLILKPIERMIIKVNGIAKNPLSAKDANLVNINLFLNINNYLNWISGNKIKYLKLYYKINSFIFKTNL